MTNYYKYMDLRDLKKDTFYCIDHKLYMYYNLYIHLYGYDFYEITWEEGQRIDSGAKIEKNIISN